MDSDNDDVIFDSCCFFLIDKLNKNRFEEYIHKEFLINIDNFKKNGKNSKTLDECVIKINSFLRILRKESNLIEDMMEKDMGIVETEKYLDKFYDLPIVYPSLCIEKKKIYKSMNISQLCTEKCRLLEMISLSILNGDIELFREQQIILYYLKHCIKHKK